MSVLHINNITNKEGTGGPTIAGITTVDSTGFMRVPVGSTGRRTVSDFVPNSIIDDGLVLYLDAANTKSYPGSGTTWTDLSGNGNTGTLVNGVGYSASNGGALVFDGVDDYVDFSFANPFAETIIVWAKSATSNWNENGWISSSRRQNGHIMHPNGTSRNVNYYILNSSATYASIGSVAPDDITIPHMYSITTNGSNSHKCYFDNILVNEDTSNISRTASPSNQVWYLGRDDTGSRFGNGNIYNCLRYNRALTAAEILQNYNALAGRYS